MATQSLAQRLGFRAGLNSANMLVKDNTQTYSNDYSKLKGFSIGPVLELPMDDDRCFFETGLLLSQRGFQVDKINESNSPDISSAHIDTETSLYYLNIPMTIKRTLFEVCDLKLYTTMGGYMSVGLSGKTEGVITETSPQASRISTPQNSEVNWGTDANDAFKRMDYGLSMGAGLEVNTVNINLSYGMGLANISADQSEGRKAKNRVWSLSVAYFLGK